jgi:hypothetical protein
VTALVVVVHLDYIAKIIQLTDARGDEKVKQICAGEADGGQREGSPSGV